MEPHAAEPAVAAASLAAVSRSRRHGAGLLAATHVVVDIFPMAITSLMIVLSDRLALSAAQETAVWVATPIFSGLFQPLFAWLGDRYDTRLCGPLGLVVAAVCIGSIGFARTFGQLICLQVAGVIGVGMYHPAAASVAGQMGSRAAGGRAFAMSVFIAAGMAGHTLGPILATRINDWLGMGHLAWLIPPSLLLAVLLHRPVRDVPHRPHDHRVLRAGLSRAESSLRWRAAVLLSVHNALRFCVNIGMYILLNYWAYAQIPADPDAAAILAGNLTAATTIGMGAGALAAGRYLPAGSERWTFALFAFGGAACVALVNVAASAGLGLLAVYPLVCLGAVGFFGIVPASIGLGQRLLPSHAGLVTSLLMGVGWMFGAAARPVSSLLLGGASLEEAHALTSGDFNRAFIGFAALLALAGGLSLAMPRRAIRSAAQAR